MTRLYGCPLCRCRLSSRVLVTDLAVSDSSTIRRTQHRLALSFPSRLAAIRRIVLADTAAPLDPLLIPE